MQPESPGTARAEGLALVLGGVSGATIGPVLALSGLAIKSYSVQRVGNTSGFLAIQVSGTDPVNAAFPIGIKTMPN
jgi:hypothetical protein